MALRSTGFSQSLHLTMPTVDFSGEAPKIFMSRAYSHCVGGDGGALAADSSAEEDGCGESGTLSHEKGEPGSGDELALSLSVIVAGA